MYAALLLVMTGMSLWLESWAGVLATALPMGILVMRIRLEERFLSQALPDYRAYAERVPWRLLPGIW